jgi:hypothetical protein
MDALAALLSNLRARDIEELHEVGMTPDVVHATLDAMPAVEFKIFGSIAFIAFHAITPRCLQVAMLATDEWPSVAREVYRWGVRECRPKLLALGYRRAEVRTQEGHEDAIRMLEHFGFELECRIPRYGASGATFLQYRWQLEKTNVLVIA